MELRTVCVLCYKPSSRVCLFVCLFVCCCCCCCLVYFFTLIVLSVFTYLLWVSVYSLLSHFPHLPTFSAFSLLSYLFFLRFILHLTSILFSIQFLTRGMSPHCCLNCQSVLSEPVATHATTWRNLAVERGFTTITPSTSSLHTPLQGKINKAHHILMLAHQNDYSEFFFEKWFIIAILMSRLFYYFGIAQH